MRLPIPAVLRRSGLWLPVLVLALALPSLVLPSLALPAWAVDGRDFAGYYAVSDVADLGDRVQFRMALQLANFSAGDLEGPVVALMNSVHGNRAQIGPFPAIKEVKAGHHVILHQQFTVSKAEFEQWDSRGPRVVVRYRDAKGGVVERGVQMARRPMLPEAE